MNKPPELKSIPRRYKRYGLPDGVFRDFLAGGIAPDAVLVTSGMTYWYPGVREAISEVKNIYPNFPVILGGIYATLCTSHAAATSGADPIVAGHDISRLFYLLECLKLLPDGSPCPANFSLFPPPSYGLYPRLAYAAVRAAMGVRSGVVIVPLQFFARRPWKERIRKRQPGEINGLAARGIRNIAFYDDALFVDAQNHLIPVLKAVMEKGMEISFHSPNGLHARSGGAFCHAAPEP